MKKKSVSELHSMKNITYYTTVWISLSQYTAVSRLVSILPTLDLKTEYTYAELEAAMNKARSGVYWSTELYSILKEALDDEFKASGADSSERVVEADALIKRLASRGVGTTGATPIPKDDTIHQIDTKSDSVYDSITNNTQKEMSSATGGSQVGIYRDIEKGNYASIKAAISFDEETYKIEFNKIVNIVIDEYLERLFQIGIQTNRIKVSRRLYFANPMKYMLWDIMRTSKRVIDEQKKANADAKNLESGTTTLSEIYAGNGKDYITEVKKQKLKDMELEEWEMKMRETKGLPIQKEENDE